MNAIRLANTMKMTSNNKAPGAPDGNGAAAGAFPSMFAGCLLALALVFAPASAAGDIEAGKKLALPCAACHGVDGNSNNPAWPNLAGQHATYIDKQLRDFRDGVRQDAQMTPFVAHLSDEDIASLAAYYAAQKPCDGEARAASVELGERLYRAGDADKGVAACMACHGPAGAGNPAANYPRINAQHAAYTEAQLKAFRTEVRDNDHNGVMRDIAGRMSNESISAVANYLQGLH